MGPPVNLVSQARDNKSPLDIFFSCVFHMNSIFYQPYL